MNTVFRLAKNTLKESMREPVFFLMLATALIMIGLFPTISMFVFRKQLKLVIDSAMATTLLFGLFVAVLSAAHTISREMKNGTVLLLMSKPVTRAGFVFAKILGIMGALTMFTLICTSASFTSVLIAKDQFQLDYIAMSVYFGVFALCALFGGIQNFLAQKSFSSHAVFALFLAFPIMALILYLIRISGMEHIDPEEFIPAAQLIPALLLMFPAIWTMGAISAALATRLDFVSNLLICLALFLAGLVSQYFIRQWLGDSVLSGIFCALIPNWQYFWMADALTNQTTIPMRYLAWTLGYVGFHISLWSAWALFLFHDSELARDSR